MEAFFSVLILAVTLILVLIRPRDISEAWWAGLGGVVVLVVGLVSLRQAWRILLDTQDALILLIGMMALSAVAEKAGFFEWAASIAARAGRGRVLLLYAMVFVVGTLVTAGLSLDATAIVLTPIVYSMVIRLRLTPLPFMFACVYTANTASMFLPISNLTNLLAYNAFGLGFMKFGLVMFIPAALAVLANGVLFVGIFRKNLRGSYDKGRLSFASENPAFFRTSAGGVAGVLVAFFVAPLFGIPIGLVALVVGAIVVIVARVRGWVSLREVAGSISWGILVLVVGLFLVVQGVENAGLAGLVSRAFTWASPGDGLVDILGVTVGSALGSNIINNVPMVVVALNSLKPLISDGTLSSAAAYATLIGTNVGPNLTTVGSLATLIWLSIARSKGMEISVKEYLKIGSISTPVILLAAGFGLWISLRLFGG